jgi:serine/threonine protein kinase
VDGHESSSPRSGRAPSTETTAPDAPDADASTVSHVEDSDIADALCAGETPFPAWPFVFPERDGPFPHDFGRYRLLEWLGGGGMGSVYLALDLKLDIKVALKIPRFDLEAHSALKERFYREARHAARLVHPGLGWVLDVGQVDGLDYLVQRYVAGTPLSRHPFGSPREAAALIRDVAIAMTAAHREGVIHRDLKPSNIIVTPEGCPVVVDFGLALSPDDIWPRATEPGMFVGTPDFASPEQLRGDADRIGPWTDIFALGCVLYQRLARRLPFSGPRLDSAFEPDVTPPPPPSTYRAEVDPALDAICLKALARDPEDRQASMAELAAALYAYLEGDLGPATSRRPQPVPMAPSSPLVRRDTIRFVFVGQGSSMPSGGPAPDRLCLDVGNDLRLGVIDHHQSPSYEGSTTRLVASNPDLVAGAVQPRRDPGAPFTIVLHESPDFDSVASVYLAVGLLTTGGFPPGTEALARYADKIDAGSIGHTLSQPFTPYAAYMQLLHRHARLGRRADHAYWRECVQQGLGLVEYAIDRSLREGVALPSVDALACPNLFDEDDRRDVLADVERYRRKLTEPTTMTRVVRLSLPGQFGGRVDVDTLMVRDVQNEDDPERCVFFKDWARSDRDRSPGGEGFHGLCVFMPESPRGPRRCILSVTPDCGASLRGLAALLDEAESERRRQVYGDDDRVIEPATGAPRPPRAGYDNADPWYDGRAHGFTIVDSPRSGTHLTAEEVESIFLSHGGHGVPR